MKKKYLMSLAFVLATSGAMAQIEVLNIWEGEAPFNKGVSVQEINSNGSVLKVTVPQLARYKAVDKFAAKPAVIIVPGGAYAYESTINEGLNAAEWFTNHGYEAFVLKYRLPDDSLVNNSSNVPLLDAQQAIYYVRKNAGLWNVDPAKVGIIGFSAGGHLAAAASTLFAKPVDAARTTKDVRPDFSILLYPVVSMDSTITHRNTRINLIGKNPDSALVDYYSLENQVSVETPITLMVHSVDDGAVPVANTDRYAANLHKKGGKVTKIILPEGGHGFGFDVKRVPAYWTGYLNVWLEKYIDPKN